jgi:hypothetical protein
MRITGGGGYVKVLEAGEEVHRERFREKFALT